MRMLLLGVLLVAVSGIANAGQTCVNGYYRKNGTYVQGYCRSTPDSTKNNNWGSSSSSDLYQNRRSPYGRDQDGDGISNQHDYDDDGDGIGDDYERD